MHCPIATNYSSLRCPTSASSAHHHGRGPKPPRSPRSWAPAWCGSSVSRYGRYLLQLWTHTHTHTLQHTGLRDIWTKPLCQGPKLLSLSSPMLLLSQSNYAQISYFQNIFSWLYPWVDSGSFRFFWSGCILVWIGSTISQGGHTRDTHKCLCAAMWNNHDKTKQHNHTGTQIGAILQNNYNYIA